MKENRTYQTTINIILIIVAITMVLPLVLLFMSSITDENMLIANGYSFFPKKFSLEAYQYIMSNTQTILRSYGITVFVTVFGTALGTLITAMMSFPLSLKDLPGKRVITFFVFFTMLFNGGLVPSYIMWTSFGITNTIWAYIFPFILTNAFNIILIRTFFASTIPHEMYESAEIDGAGYFTMFWRMVIPLGKPILVTIGLFTGLYYWNDWLNGLYFVSNGKLLSIQALLRSMMQNVQSLALYSSLSSGSSTAQQVPRVSIRMAIAFVAILPILVIYPSLQKYFARGIMLGAVKG
jgi:putative aldouronate transport system permease protein